LSFEETLVPFLSVFRSRLSSLACLVLLRSALIRFYFRVFDFGRYNSCIDDNMIGKRGMTCRTELARQDKAWITTLP